MTSDTVLPHETSALMRHDEVRLAVITVTFHPDIGKLKRQLNALPKEATSVIVDNASNADEVMELKHLVTERVGTYLIQNDKNIGLAAAVNRGAAHVAEHLAEHDFLLLMDQDSQPRPDSVENLISTFLQLEVGGYQVGCVGPLLVDDTTGLQYGFHCVRGWRWTRVFSSPGDTKPISCANLNGSGTLVRTSLFNKLGGLDEALFIDHVDTEWAFRVLEAGLKLFGIPQATFDHGMGEYGLRFWWFGWRVWPQRSPLRHYYLFRNAVCLLHRPYVPRVWKFWAVIKLFLTLVIHAIFDPDRRQQMNSMLSGICDAYHRPIEKK